MKQGLYLHFWAKHDTTGIAIILPMFFPFERKGSSISTLIVVTETGSSRMVKSLRVCMERSAKNMCHN